MRWDGTLPRRRYAMFLDLVRRTEYMVVVTGNDMTTAPLWGGFLYWVGGEREEVIRKTDHGRNR